MIGAPPPDPALLPMRKFSLLLVLLMLAGAAVAVSVILELQTRRNAVSFSIVDPDAGPVTLTIAVLGDIHVPESPDALASTRQLLAGVKAAKPDIIRFVGDYIVDPSGIDVC